METNTRARFNAEMEALMRMAEDARRAHEEDIRGAKLFVAMFVTVLLALAAGEFVSAYRHDRLVNDCRTAYGIDASMTKAEASALIDSTPVFLDALPSPTCREIIIEAAPAAGGN